MSFRNVYLCVWIGTWMRGILYQKQPSPGYRENIQQEEVLVKILQRNWSFSTNLSCRASLSLSQVKWLSHWDWLSSFCFFWFMFMAMFLQTQHLSTYCWTFYWPNKVAKGFVNIDITVIQAFLLHVFKKINSQLVWQKCLIEQFGHTCNGLV